MSDNVELPISKIRTPDGVLHDFSTMHYISLPADSEYNVNWMVGDFTGTVTQITGTTDDYLLTVPGAVEPVID